ncbi:MAG: hypothetical protein MJ184_07560 [Treponema sp.]|uniref:hypothetical protein n=1 Tax=Treponema sp. TaxID=166 RepID=UPI00298E73BB|nr:hypothetical protein [Treponema sp.]MCQ2601204.1 hypothetical protein [Treponema sp.]
MSVKQLVVICLSVSLLTGCLVFLCIQNVQLKKSAFELESSLKKYFENTEIQIESLKKDVEQLSENQERNKSLIVMTLSELKDKSDLQYTKTVGMKNTYDALLEEQKKKTIDTAENDTEFQRIKAEALLMYQKGNYVSSYEGFEKLVKLDFSDMESLMYKMKSLYYMNPADSSRYSEIIEIMRTLKINSAADKECVEIEKAVLLETEGLSE